MKSGIGERNIEKAERDIDLVRAKIEGRKEELKLVERRIRECRIVAPNDGRLVSIPCKYTRYVQKGDVAVKMSSGETVKGLAYVDENVVRKVRRNQNVRISSGVFNRLEYGSFYGKVDRIYDTPVQDPATNATRYPVEITIDAQGRPLRLGSSAEFAIAKGWSEIQIGRSSLPPIIRTGAGGAARRSPGRPLKADAGKVPLRAPFSRCALFYADRALT